MDTPKTVDASSTECGRHHYRRAEWLIRQAESSARPDVVAIAAAKVHALLAIAAALDTTYGEDD